MKVCFFGFSAMDYKGEEINEPFFLKKMVDSLDKKGNETFYLYNEGGVGINDEDVFNSFNIKSKRLSIDSYSEYKYNEYTKFSQEELYDIIEFNHKLSFLTIKKDIKKQLLHTVLTCLEKLREYDEKYNFDLFIFFGNSTYSNIIRAYCLKNNKRFFNMENGYFRPYTLMFDPKGVNYESSIPRDPNFYTNIQVDKNRLSQFLYKPEKAEINRDETWEYREKFYKHYDIDVKKLERNNKGAQNTKTDEDTSLYDNEYIYVPFQLETDSQIIKHSKRIKTMKQLVENCSKALKKYNETNNKNLKMIFKTHPLYRSEIEIIDIIGINEICEKDPNLIFLTEGNNSKLLDHAKAVITINSTVGLEALIRHKPVITLGDAFYGIENIAYVCEDLEQLDELIKKALETKVNTDLIDQFIFYLRFDYFVEVYRNNPDDESIENLINRMLNKEEYSR